MNLTAHCLNSILFEIAEGLVYLGDAQATFTQCRISKLSLGSLERMGEQISKLE